MAEKLPNKKIVVVLPAYHAVKTLKQTFDNIPNEWVDDIILVDDASNDDTAKLSRSLGIKTFVHPANRGYGGNQKTCYREALALRADIVVMVHPDFQYDPKFIPEILKPIASGRCDAVFGSRMLTKGTARAGGMPLWKYLANIALTTIGNLILGYNLSEYHSGFRAYSREALEHLALELNSNNFVFDTEIIAQLKSCKFKIGEIPITTRYFPEASMIGFWKSCQYGLSFLFVLTSYFLHSIGLRRDARFSLVCQDKVKCFGCGATRNQVFYKKREKLVMSNLSYSITESVKGIHGEIRKCLTCQLVFVPRENNQNLTDAYAEQSLDKEYLNEERGRRKSAKRSLAKIKTLISGDNLDKKKLIDIGTGPGFFVDEANKLGWDASGLEVAKLWCHYAQNNLGLTSVRQGKYDNLSDFPDAHFSVISAWDVIEHIDNPIAFLKLAHQKLAKDAIIALSTPDWGSFFARLMGEQWHAIIPAHITYFTYPVLRDYLKQYGFEIILRRSYTRFFSLRYLFNRLLHKSGGTFLRNIIIPINLFDEIEIYARKI